MKAKAELIAAFQEVIRSAPTGATSAASALVLDRCEGGFYGHPKPKRDHLKTADDVIRHCASTLVMGTLQHDWSIAREAMALLDTFGIDAKKIVDRISPPQAAAKSTIVQKKTAAKKGAK